KDDVLDLRVADPEPKNAQWDPGKRRNRANELDYRIDCRSKPFEPAHGEAERNAEHGGGSDRNEHTTKAVDDVRDQNAARPEILRSGEHRGGRRQHHVELRV